ncbi:MAG: FtsX-like permease family protein [Mucinivorans sp.]
MNTIFRNFYTTLRRFVLSSTLNILGLGVAYAAFMIIILQVNYEYSYDTCYADSERIYRVDIVQSDGSYQAPLSQPIVDTYGPMSPLVESYTILMPSFGNSYVTVENAGQKVGFTEHSYLVYPGFCQVFSPVMIEGSADALLEPTKVLIPASMAERLFGSCTGVLGSKLNIGIAFNPNKEGAGGEDFEVGGVYQDFPSNGQIQNYILQPLQPRMDPTSWGSCNYFMYVKLCATAEPEAVLAEWKRGFDFASQTAWDDSTRLDLIPIQELYYDERNKALIDYVATGDRSTTNILLSVALLIIVVAAINFINFSTSMAPLRMKSINIQKVLGSTNPILRLMLVAEAVGISVLACVLGLLIADVLSYTPLNSLISGGINMEGNLVLVGYTVAMSIVVGILSGLYPAFYTTKFPPAMVLKGSFAMSPKGRVLRMGLIGFQFVVSTGLIIGAIFLQLQNDYLRHANTGVDMEHTVIVTIGGSLLDSKSFENQLRNSSQVTGVGFANQPIGTGNTQQGWSGRIGQQDQYYDAIVVSWQVPEVLGIHLKGGRNFTPEDANKKDNTYIFNETAARKFLITPGDKVGRWHNDSLHYSDICAISQDFNYKSLHSVISPAALVVEGTTSWHSTMSVLYVGIKGDPYTAVDHIKRVAASVDAAYPLDIQFYDTAFNALYQKDRQATSLITLFSMLAIIISLVGVFGLVVFETQYRRREIGLRKVYGSTVGQILAMFSARFVWMVLVCFVLAAPLAYIGVDLWLESFVYRTPIHWWVFLVALLIVLSITLATVTIQSYRSAIENPVKSLKGE